MVSKKPFNSNIKEVAFCKKFLRSINTQAAANWLSKRVNRLEAKAGWRRKKICSDGTLLIVGQSC